MGAPQDVAKGLDLFRTLIFDNVVEAVLVEWESSLLAIPIIGGILHDLQMQFANRIYDKLSGQVILSTILFVDVQHRQAFDTASTDLKGIAIQYGIKSPQYEEAHAKEKAALKRFVQFGVAQPGRLT